MVLVELVRAVRCVCNEVSGDATREREREREREGERERGREVE